MPDEKIIKDEHNKDQILDDLLSKGERYCTSVDEGTMFRYYGSLPPDATTKSVERRVMLLGCSAISKLDFENQLVDLSEFGFTCEEVSTGVEILEHVKGFWQIGDMISYLKGIDYQTRELVITYLNYFPDTWTAEISKARIAFCTYLVKKSQMYTQRIQEEVKQGVVEKVQKYQEQGLPTKFLGQFQDLEVYGCFSMFGHGTSGNVSLYPNSAVVYLQTGRLDGYSKTAVHERTHQIVEEKQLGWNHEGTWEQYLDNSFNYNEVLVDLLACLDDPESSENDYCNGVRHLAHLLEVASIQRYAESGKNQWKNYVLELITSENKVDLYKAIQNWYDDSRPEGYGSFVEEMLIYSDRSIRNRNEICNDFEEACTGWSWLKWGFEHGVDVELLRKIYEQTQANSLFDTQAYMLQFDDNAVCSVLK